MCGIVGGNAANIQADGIPLWLKWFNRRSQAGIKFHRFLVLVEAGAVFIV
jgi:hypothetical protein